MLNRLLPSWQRLLLIVSCLSLWTFQLSAQCECAGNSNTCSGNFYTLTYMGPDTIFVDTTCEAPFPNAGSVTFVPLGGTYTFDPVLTGYNFGDMVPGGTVVSVTYIATNGMVYDTLCFPISFVDNSPPVINGTLSSTSMPCAAADYDDWLDDNLDLLEAISNDNCGTGSGIIAISHNGPATFTNNCGNVTVIFTVSDLAGNSVSQAANFATTDSVSPSLLGVPDDTLVNCTLIPLPPTVTADDNCASSITVSFSQTSTQTNTGACSDFTYEITRTWTASDGCGNSVVDTQLVHVQDTIEPTFDIPANLTISCSANSDTLATGNISNATDNCSASVTVAFNQVITPGTCPQERTIARTWTVTDACGNSDAKTQIVTVEDNTPPLVTFPGDIEVDCADAADLSITGQPTAVSDNCDMSALVTKTDINSNQICPNSYTIERTWRAEDDCGNYVDSVQIITVTDETPPVIDDAAQNMTIVCSDTTDADDSFDNWVADNASATASDNCGGTLTWTAVMSGTNDPAVLSAPSCAVPTIGVFRRSTIDFVVTDVCGNTDTTTAVFTVADNTPPVVTNCPSDLTVQNDPGVCESAQLLALPTVTEECDNTVTAFSFSLTELLTVPVGSDLIETPVDDVEFNFTFQGPPYTVTSAGTLVISLVNVDGEQPTEFFNIYGEGGVLLGSTALTPVQCSNSTTSITLTAAQINAWGFDGTITITLEPNIPAALPGRFAVNNICPDNAVTAALDFSADFPTHIKFEYSVNAGTRQNLFPIASFSETILQGTNNVTYYVTDCAGNETTCQFDVTVEDKEAPEIACPSDMIVNLGTGDCTADVEIPLFSAIVDNCGVTIPTTQSQPVAPTDRLITYTFNPNLNDFVADDKTFIFMGLQGNATPGNVFLTISLQADVSLTNEFFQIYDNDGNLLGTTAPGQPHVTPGDCGNISTATFSIDAETFNEWATAGNIQFTAQSFMSFPIPPAGPGWGINPCDTSQVHGDGDTDGSFIFATISYESISPVFSATGASTLDPLTLVPPLEPQVINLAQGVTTFSYEVIDLAGNLGQCSFDVDVRDVEAPIALCGPTFVDINPSGFVIDTIYPAEIDLGSSDNCTIASMTVSPNTIDCLDAFFGSVSVTLTVTDASGNVSTCNTFVTVTSETPSPTASSDCGSTFLQLFANPPASPGGNNAFQYTWYTPAGIAFAYVENPVILDADNGDLGFYNVVIQGVTGCQAVETVQVTCDLLPIPQPTVSTPSGIVCEDENIVLNTPSLCGTSVQYQWYAGTAPNGMWLATTTQPSYSMTPPASGTYSFYVVTLRNGCNSDESASITVQVKTKPVAMPSQASLSLCAGEQILFTSINNAPGTTCHWTGPCGFESFNCAPSPIANAVACNGGLYQLVVTNNGCESDPAFVSVNVIAQPPTPSISNTTSAANPACEGSSLTLTATPVAGAISYQWTTPMFTTISTPTNVLTISPVELAKDAGQWTVKAIGNPCVSATSAATTVHVSALPEAISAAANPTSACEGQNIQLSGSSASPNVSYLWTYPNAQTNALPNPVLSNVTGNFEGDYLLTVTNQFGCSATTEVSVEILSRVNITGISSDAPNCVLGAVDVHLSATLFPLNNGTYQFLWTGPDGFSSTLASATVPGATDDDSGPYTLVVTNSDGCSSLPATVNVTVPEILPTPGSPVLNLPNPFCEGDDVTMTTTPFPAPGVLYQWTLPTGTYTTSNPSLSVDNLTSGDNGPCYVRYFVNGCPSGESGFTILSVNPAPDIQPASNSPVCEGETLELSLNCSAGATYEWSGPGGFSSSVCNPVVANANPNLHAGTYTVRKKSGGCWSEELSLNIQINPEPEVPTAVNAGPYCGSTDVATLTVTPVSATPGASYVWYNTSGMPLGSATPQLNFGIPNPGQYGDGTQEFYVVASLNGCLSLPSVPTLVAFNAIPSNVAEAGADLTDCEDQLPIFLNATTPSAGTGLWTLVSGNPNGVALANPDEPTTTVDGLTPGVTYVFQWTLSNGACENYSSDQASVFLNAVESSEAGAEINACHTTNVTLDADMPLSGIGQWSQSQAQMLLGVVVEEPTNPGSPISGLVPGNSYLFTWTIDGGCGTSIDDVLVTVSDESAFAGADRSDCGDGSTVMDGIAAQSDNGTWTSPDANLDIVTPGDPNTIVHNLQSGGNLLIWTINDGDCGHYSVDSVLIDYNFQPVLSFDTMEVSFAGIAEKSVTVNDQISGTFTINIVQQPLHGTAELDANGILEYRADATFAGEDFLTYEVCVEGCECATTTVTFRVGIDAECVVPSIITPNNDGVNDAFVVPCLAGDRFPGSVVSIFNQWGDEVFHAEPYVNDWTGTFDGEDLPAGTYFYFIELGNGDKPLSGYLIIQR